MFFSQTRYQSHTKSYHKTENWASKHFSEEPGDRCNNREIKAARCVLNEFEGVRFEGRKKPPVANGTMNPPALFNSAHQKISRAEATILGLVNESNKKRKKEKRRTKRKRLKVNGKRDQLGSKLSVDYQHFEFDKQNHLIKPSPELEECADGSYGSADHMTNPRHEQDGELKEYDVDNNNFITSDDFYKTNSRQNTARRLTESSAERDDSLASMQSPEYMDSLLDVTVKFHGPQKHDRPNQENRAKAIQTELNDLSMSDTLSQNVPPAEPVSAENLFSAEKSFHSELAEDNAEIPVTDIDTLLTEDLPPPPDDF